MFYLCSILCLILVSLTRVTYGVENKNADTHRSSTIPDLGTFKTPFPSDLADIVPKENKDFQQPPKMIYHVNPNTKQELDNMLAYTENLIPKPDEDLIDLTSQRFDKIQTDYAKKAATTERLFTTRSVKNILRQNTPSPTVAKNARIRAFALMTQFVYAARYKLMYGQRLRGVYNTSLSYRIGYGFAVMRDVKQEQLTLYSTMSYNLNRHYDYVYKKQRNPMYYSIVYFETYLELYEKIVKLDVDMMDTIAFVSKLEELRQEEDRTRVIDSTTPDDDDDSG